MYAIVKTGGKQYKAAPGDILDIEKIDGEPGKKVSLDAICIVDGDKTEADAAKASKTKVEATILDQYKEAKKIVFKFKKRKSYKKLNGHRQNLTRVQITAVGSDAFKAAPKKAAAKPAAKKTETAAKPAAKKTTAAAKKPAAKKTTATAAKKTTAAAKKPAAKKTTTAAKKPAAKKTTAAKKPAAKKTEE